MTEEEWEEIPQTHVGSWPKMGYRVAVSLRPRTDDDNVRRHQPRVVEFDSSFAGSGPLVCDHEDRINIAALALCGYITRRHLDALTEARQCRLTGMGVLLLDDLAMKLEALLPPAGSEAENIEW
jgi:hypothetical protein